VTPRAVIAEDEPTLAEELCELLSRVWPELEICAVAPDGIRALQAMETHRPDVLFLDIQMPGATGLDVARLSAGRCHVVFVTAFDQYAIDAFETGAIDYLMKPINAARLFSTVKRVKERLNQPSVSPEVGALPAHSAALDPDKQYLRWINASRGADICIVTTDEVCYFKAEDKYTIVFTEKAEALIRKPIKELIARLDPSVFWQIHRSTVVNASAIAGVTRDFRGHLVVRLKQRPEPLAVAESYNHLFRQT
jgi:DNA-binding LytR/AlgR family response regulator